MVKKKDTVVVKERFWTKAAFMATNDITTVAIYRIATGVMGMVLFALVSYFGNRLVAASDKMNNDLTKTMTEIMSIREDISSLKAQNVMMQDRLNRITDRLNLDENRVTTLEARLDFVLMRGR